MEYFLKCKKIDTAIRRARKMLVEKVEKDGPYENFGQKEVRLIKEHFIDISSYTDEENKKRSLLDSFSNWCSSYNGEAGYFG